jgi:glucose-6-phosphate dehydrogenase assembly protein OpcA
MQDPLTKIAQMCDKNFKAVGDYQIESNKNQLALTMALLTILIDKGLTTTAEFDELVKVCRKSIDASVAEEARRQKDEKLSDLLERLTRPSKQ